METISNNKKPCLIQTSQGFSVLYQEKYLYSKYNPSREILNLINSTAVLPGTLFLCCSPVLSYGLNELSAKLTDDCFMLACELEDELYAFEQTQDDFNSIKNFSFITKNEALSLPEILQEPSFTLKSGITLPPAGTFKRIIRIDFSAGINFNQNLYNQIYSFASSSIMTFWKNRITLTKFGRRFSQDLFKNLKILSATCPITTWFNKLENPIIIFGAGESLEEGIKKIKPLAERSYILCADTALRPLLKAGLQPDGVFIEEAQSVILKAFTGALKNKCHVFAGLSSVPGLSRLKEKERISFFTTVYAKTKFLDTLLDQSFMPPGNAPFGSVGLTLLYYALKFRKNENVPVFIYGLDFSYSVGKTHANGTMAHLNRLALHNRLIPIENYTSSFSQGSIKTNGKNQKPVITTQVLESYAKLFNNLFNSEKNVFDASSTGLLLKLPHKEPCEKDFPMAAKKEIKTALYSSKETQDIQNYLEEEKNALYKIRDLLTGKGEFEKLSKEDALKELKTLLENREYLYLHFADAHRTDYNQSFLNRVRTEIDFFLKIME